MATGHDPLTGLERLYLGFDRMQQLLAGAGARAYFCGHLHWKTFAWLGETLVSQVDSQGKSDTPAFALVSLDHTGPAARFVDMEPFVAWPLVLITTPANPDLGRQNPYATQYPTSGELTVRAIAFSPGGVQDVVFQLGGYDQQGAEVSPHVFETTYALPDAAADLTLKATATSTIGTNTDEITVNVAP